MGRYGKMEVSQETCLEVILAVVITEDNTR